MSRASGPCDRYGLPLGTDSAPAVALYRDGLDRHLSWDLGAEDCFEQALAADETFVLAHAGLAVARRFQGDAAAARASAARACVLAASGSRRERQHARAVAAFVAGQSALALALLREHLTDFPRDALTLQLATSLLAGSGTLDRREQLLALLEDLAPAYGDDWWFLGVSAYAYQELDQLEPARRLAERSLARRPRNASAAHALAHVFYETADHPGGSTFLADWLTDYAPAAPYHCHLSWHRALAELVQGNVRTALDLYERTISPTVASAWTTLADASSLLWRVQLYEGDTPNAGATVGLPWAAVCDLATRNANPSLAFASAHAALAYAAAGDLAALEKLARGIQLLARQGDALAAAVTLPLVQGIAAFGWGAYDEAADQLQAVAGQLVRLGGTNAQREVFEETLLVAQLRAGRLDRAEALLRHRLARRSSARDLAWLTRARSLTPRPPLPPC
jgi:tetratricopeptide (TPR) repeat protein